VSDEEREYLNEMIRSLNNQLVDALRERDEARREVCRNEANHLPTMVDPRREAQRRGWDCFKQEDSK
jgi:chorismate mutase